MKPKIRSVLGVVSRRLTEHDVAYALIGAMALGVYGLPRYTSDIDLLADGDDWQKISTVMESLGYECFQKTRGFAQFDSPLGVYGKIDFMLVGTEDGRRIMGRCIWVDDRLLGNQPVVEPTDYIVLKLMALANNPERGAQDEADIATIIRAYQKETVPEIFGPLNSERLYYYAERFRRVDTIRKYLASIDGS